MKTLSTPSLRSLVLLWIAWFVILFDMWVG